MTNNSSNRLEAVNRMLAVIGERPVNSLSGGAVADAVGAIQILDAETRSVLSEGWSFNSDVKFPLPRQAFGDPLIFVPDTALSCDPSDKTRDVVTRSGKLYDRERRSFFFPDETKVECDIVWALPFEDLPVPAQEYITIRAARKLQQAAVGSDLLDAFTAQDEQRARALLRRSTARKRDKNILRASPDIATLIAR